MDCPGSLAHAEMSEGVLFTCSMLHRFGLPYNYARLENSILPESCPCCSAPLWDPGLHPSRPDRIFIWQCHAGRCGGDGRRLQAHEVLKLAVKRLVLSSYTPGGSVYPAASVLIEPQHLRQDRSRPGDIFAIGNGLHRKDVVMDLVITSVLQQSCLPNAAKGSDFVLRTAEAAKFRKDARSCGPIQSSATRRFVPLAINHLGLRGGHFQALLKEFATTLVTRPGGCVLLQGPFGLSINGALHKILNTWGSRLTWTAQRQHAAQIIGSMETFLVDDFSHSVQNPRGIGVNGPVSAGGWEGG
jgi:hypothetical protein